VEKIRAIGGDAVKVLAWYRPDADAGINEHQKRFVREIGQDCARYDIPYVLELLVYPFLAAPITRRLCGIARQAAGTGDRQRAQSSPSRNMASTS